ncbi:MAG: YbjQ family protein [Cyanobacteria bacterium SZAS LIN-3]|nr:YbjQ family protein [Cyanobacteria bacterium SZAS LIN-3]MBS2009145.1 YbjQ family protein [Cyanobacteria bacterium SZAS TMP-1]
MPSAANHFYRLAVAALLSLAATSVAGAARADNVDQSKAQQRPTPQYQPINLNPGQPAPAAALPPPVAGIPTILATTTPQIDGYHVSRYFGVVRGVKVFQPTIGQNFRASLKGIVGGSIGAYSEMCERARQEAFDQLMARSSALGANAVVGLRFDSSSFSLGGSEMGTEVICYGTAVLLEADH